VWVDQSLTLQPSFKQIVANDYKATLASVDFQNKVYSLSNITLQLLRERHNNLLLLFI
jgi:serpin B